MKLKIFYQCGRRRIESEDGRWGWTHENPLMAAERWESLHTISGNITLDGKKILRLGDGARWRYLQGNGALDAIESLNAQEFLDAANKQASRECRNLTIVEEVGEDT